MEPEGAISHHRHEMKDDTPPPGLRERDHACRIARSRFDMVARPLRVKPTGGAPKRARDLARP
jgi:hypothetical protein